MNDNLSKILIFASGAAIGSFVTYKVLKNKFDKIAQEEIDSVKRYYKEKNQETEQSFDEMEKDMEEDKPIELNNRDYTRYTKMLNDYKYNTSFDVSEENEDIEEKDDEVVEEEPEGLVLENETREFIDAQPYIIPPEEYGICQGYDLLSLTYYSDGVLTDDCDEFVEDPINLVGSDYANHFGEYEEDCVYVRNDRLRADFEICKDLRSYSDVVWRPPHLL